jgi:hypothetical protein
MSLNRRRKSVSIGAKIVFFANGAATAGAFRVLKRKNVKKIKVNLSIG